MIRDADEKAGWDIQKAVIHVREPEKIQHME